MTALILNGDPNPFLTLGCLIFAGSFLLLVGREMRERVLRARYEREDFQNEVHWHLMTRQSYLEEMLPCEESEIADEAEDWLARRPHLVDGEAEGWL